MPYQYYMSNSDIWNRLRLQEFQMKKISTYSNFSVRQSAKLRDFESFVCTIWPAHVNMVLIEYAWRVCAAIQKFIFLVFGPNHLLIPYQVYASREDSGETGMGWSRRGGGRGSGPPPPLKNHKNIGFLCNTGPDPRTNCKATKPAFYVGPASARHRNAISMAFRWRAVGCPFMAVFWILYPPINLKKQKKKNKKKQKKNVFKFGPPLTYHSGSAHDCVSAQSRLGLRWSPLRQVPNAMCWIWN